jgi:hypothetical protein
MRPVLPPKATRDYDRHRNGEFLRFMTTVDKYPRKYPNLVALT